MSKVIIFSTVFPSYHPRKGEPTYFVEKIWNSFHVDSLGERYFIPFEEDLWSLNKNIPYDIYINFRDSLFVSRTQKFQPKYHTIRAGKRWKIGDKFSPRIWSGKPYASKQIIIADDIELKKVWNIEIELGDYFQVLEPTASVNVWNLISNGEVAKNDGLGYEDFVNWFNHPKKKEKRIEAQILCWNENINY